MGLLDNLRRKKKADVGRGGISPKPNYSTSLDDAISNKAKQSQGGSWTPKIKSGLSKVRSGYEKYEKGKKQVGGLLKDLGTLIPDQGYGGSTRRASSRGRRRSNSGLEIDFGWPSTNDLLGSGPRKSSGGRKRSGGKGMVPIYKGSRIVGYRHTGGHKKRAPKRDPWDIDLGI